MAGAMEALQATTIEYASTRKQFGREISKFQAIQHQIAVMAQEVMAARMAAQGAFVGPPLDVSPLRAAAAKARAGQAAQQVAAIAHAVHGAIGMTQEHHLHKLTGALHRWRLAHGGESGWARELGRWGLARKGGLVELARAM
jgi:alkylation response protein AidB-like acyl-CoA dehydrogenase